MRTVRAILIAGWPSLLVFSLLDHFLAIVILPRTYQTFSTSPLRQLASSENRPSHFFHICLCVRCQLVIFDVFLAFGWLHRMQGHSSQQFLRVRLL